MTLSELLRACADRITDDNELRADGRLTLSAPASGRFLFAGRRGVELLSVSADAAVKNYSVPIEHILHNVAELIADSRKGPSRG